MASVKCTHCGATLKTANPVAAGKKLKCPKCAKVFVVEDEEEKEEEPAEEEDTGAEDEGDEEEEAPKSKKPAKASKSDDEDEEESEEEAPKKKGKDDDDEETEDDEKPTKAKGKAGDSKTPAKKGKGMLIALLLGGLLLTCCCGGGAGVGGWYYWSQQSSPAFVGNWESKNREPDGSPEITLMIIENGKGQYLRANKAPQDFKWKVVDSKTVNFDMDDQSKSFWPGNSRPNFTYTVEGDNLTLVTTTDKRTAVFNKIAGGKK